MAATLSVGVVCARHLPKMDTFGSIDAYCVLSAGGAAEPARTKTVKNSHTPSFNEDFAFEVQRGQPEPLHVRVFDWDRLGKDEFVGEVTVAVDEAGRERAYAITKDGKPVVGHDKKPAELVLRLACTDRAGAADDQLGGAEGEQGEGAEGEQAAAEKPPPLWSEKQAAAEAARQAVEAPCRLDVTVLSAAHLPKMDKLGSIDPYCVLHVAHCRTRAESAQQRTKTVKNSYSPSFGDTLGFRLSQASSPVAENALVLRLFDWDRMGKDELVAELVLPLDGVGAERAYPLQLNGAPVVGHDKKPAEVSLRLAFVPQKREPPAVDLTKPWRVEVEVVGAGHLPKQDLLGSCDPYCVLEVGGKREQTQTVKNSYSLTFGETFVFGYRHVRGGKELSLRVFDRDRVGKDDLVGEVSVVLDGVNGEEVYGLVVGGGAVMGHDKKPSELTLRLTYKQEPDRRLAVDMTKPWRVEVEVVGARHLPKADLMGSCDPYCVLEVGGRRERTQTVKDSYSPTFGERFTFRHRHVRCGGGLSVRVFDFDRMGKDDLIGEAAVVLDGVNEEEEHGLLLKGSPVIGRDKCASVVMLRLTYIQEESVDMSKPYRVDVDVISAAHLPKSDIFGSCDAYCVLELGPKRVQTQTVKNTYDPAFREVFSFVLEEETDFKISVFDWDRLSKHDPVGEALVPLDPSRKREDGEQVFVLSQERKTVMGHDQMPAEVRLKITYSVRDDAVALYVKVCDGANLPKSDVTGSCDAYVQLELCDKRHTTAVVSNSYSPEWDETFGFDIQDPKRHAADLHIQLKDKDTLTKDDFLGSAIISGSDIRDFLLEKPLGNKREIRLQVRDEKFFEVQGHNGCPTELTLQLRWGEEESSADAVLDVCVQSTDHLPSMDVAFGSCDPYVVVQLAAQKYKTQTVKRSLSPVWEQIFAFDLDDPKRSGSGPAILKLMDWDKLTADDEAGWVEIPEARIHKALASGTGFTEDLTLELWDAKHPRASDPSKWKHVKGDDGKVTTVKIRLHVSRAPPSALAKPEKKTCIHGNQPEGCKICAQIAEAEAWLRINAKPIVLKPKRALRKSDRKLQPEVMTRSEWKKEQKEARLGNEQADDADELHGLCTANAPDWLNYVDAPVWRGRNGEVLVGRDVVPRVGMRVLLARQTQRFLFEQGQKDPSAGGGGKIIKILAGTQRVMPAEYTRDGNGAFCKVVWEETQMRTKHPAGHNGQFTLVPYDQGIPCTTLHIREIVVEAAVNWKKPDPLRGRM